MSSKDPLLSARAAKAQPGTELYEFFILLAVCNTVLPRVSENGQV